LRRPLGAVTDLPQDRGGTSRRTKVAGGLLGGLLAAAGAGLVAVALWGGNGAGAMLAIVPSVLWAGWKMVRVTVQPAPASDKFWTWCEEGCSSVRWRAASRLLGGMMFLAAPIMIWRVYVETVPGVFGKLASGTALFWLGLRFIALVAQRGR